jgi:hypothetical protein
MTLRVDEQWLANFEKRRAEWEKNGTVRTHAAKGDNPAKVQAKPVVKLAERDVLKCCLEVLENHQAVAFAWRQNTGLAMGGGHAVRFSFTGCSDVLGMLKGGRFLAVETKATGKQPSPEQQAFLDAVNAAGGLGICVDDPLTLIEALDAL